jgi:hypothetical protein
MPSRERRLKENAKKVANELFPFAKLETNQN